MSKVSVRVGIRVRRRIEGHVGLSEGPYRLGLGLGLGLKAMVRVRVRVRVMILGLETGSPCI